MLITAKFDIFSTHAENKPCMNHKQSHLTRILIIHLVFFKTHKHKLVFNIVEQMFDR